MGQAEVTPVETKTSVTHLPDAVCGNGLAEGDLWVDGDRVWSWKQEAPSDREG